MQQKVGVGIHVFLLVLFERKSLFAYSGVNIGWQIDSHLHVVKCMIRHRRQRYVIASPGELWSPVTIEIPSIRRTFNLWNLSS